LFNAPQNWNHVSYQPSTGFADPRGMKPLLGNAAANSLTCHVREADANLLNLLPQSSPHLPANHSIQVHSVPCFLSVDGDSQRVRSGGAGGGHVAG
jgi:hypothetical protein